jgi:hypothetical protein
VVLFLSTPTEPPVYSGLLFDTICGYSRGLQSSPTSAEEEVLRNNRALASLRIEAYHAVLEDVSCLRILERF